MIRFVDLKTGNTFDGSYPHTFWFEGEQSINLVYTQPICFISNSEEVNIAINGEGLFHLIDTSKLSDSKLESMYEFDYHNIQKLQTNSLISKGYTHHNYFVHLIYVLAYSDQPGEYKCPLFINGEQYCVGVDFYGLDENLYINLSNNGVEIPLMIQKALYDINVHEEKPDHITLNRKWKELLSNYWEIIANKGSYKSLFNSLKWFEYGDLVTLKEVWKNNDTGNFYIQDIQQTMSDKYEESMKGFSKTSYFALYHALEQPIIKNGKVELDAEKNPELEYITTKWSVQDLALKLCMLGSFYETYFMPIHLNLLHSTIEDVVYTNTFKTKICGMTNRQDYVYNCEDIQCNIEDGDCFRLENVQCYVGPNTLFASKYDIDHDKVDIIGVQREQINTPLSDNELRDYVSQMYNDVGVIVDFKLHIPLISDDKIKREILLYKTYSNGEWGTKKIVNYKLLGNDISFSLLCPVEGEYDVKLQFDSCGGKTYTKHIKFNVIDTTNIGIDIYKVCNKKIITQENLNQPSLINDYIYARRDGFVQNPTQYIPAFSNNLYQNEFNWEGVCLNHMMILKYENITDEILTTLNSFYFIVEKKVTDKKSYLICISKIFGFNVRDNINIANLYEEIKDKIYREDYIFVPGFHVLKPAFDDKKENLDKYKVTDETTLCIVPNMAYGKYIDEYDWEFVNTSRPDLQPIKLSGIKEPFIANIDKAVLPKGYYTVIFKYRLTNEEKINTITLDSAFIKV